MRTTLYSTQLIRYMRRK